MHSLQKWTKQFDMNTNAEKLHQRNDPVKAESKSNRIMWKYHKCTNVSGNSVNGQHCKTHRIVRRVEETTKQKPLPALQRNAPVTAIPHQKKVRTRNHHPHPKFKLSSVWQGTEESLQWHRQKATLTFQKQSCVKY